MIKKEAVKLFMGMQSFHPTDILYPLHPTDKVANREMWNDWTDSLCKTGEITEHQYNTWTYPRNKYFY